MLCVPEAIEQHLVEAASTLDIVAAVALVPPEHVIARSENRDVGALVAVEEIVAVPPSSVSLPPPPAIKSSPAPPESGVVAGAAEERIVAVLTRELVVAASACQRVVAVSAKQLGCRERAIGLVERDGVVAVATIDADQVGVRHGRGVGKEIASPLTNNCPPPIAVDDDVVVAVVGGKEQAMLVLLKFAV